jgi:hypothetical protein
MTKMSLVRWIVLTAVLLLSLSPAGASSEDPGPVTSSAPEQAEMPVWTPEVLFLSGCTAETTCPSPGGGTAGTLSCTGGATCVSQPYFVTCDGQPQYCACYGGYEYYAGCRCACWEGGGSALSCERACSEEPDPHT